MLEKLEGKALELKPGGVYVIQLEHSLSMEKMEMFREHLASFGDPLGIQFAVLGPGMKIARESE